MRTPFGLLFAALLAVPGEAQSLRKPVPHEVGVLLLAHGGDGSWNDDILKVRKSLEGRFAVEVAFGMGESKPIQKAVDQLQSRGVKRIIGVPLFVNSSSEVMDQIRFAFGLAEEPSEALVNAPHSHMGKDAYKRVKLKASVDLTGALDDSPLVTEILAERARKLSRDPKRECLLLVGHGPVSDKHNEEWLAALRSHAERLRAQLGFKAADVATLRDDASRDVRAKAVQKMRSAVGALARQGRVLVVPVLLARGGIEKKIPKELEGTFFSWRGETLAPHENLSRWVIETVEAKAGAAKPTEDEAPAAKPKRKKKGLQEPEEQNEEAGE